MKKSKGKYATAVTQEISLADAKNRGAIKGLVTMRINFLLSQANADARQKLNKTSLSVKARIFLNDRT